MKHLASILAVALVATAMSGCSVLKKNSGHNHPASMPQPTPEQQEQQRTDAAAGNIAPEMIAGEWTIVRVKGQAVPQEDQMPYVNFDTSDGRFYASNGCNTINGEFKLNPDATLSLDHVATTMMLCQGVAFEHEISAILSGELKPQVKVSRVGHESYLTLSDPTVGISIEGRRHNMDFLNGQWRIAQINGKAINDEEANIFIDLGEMRVHGNTGCNFFNGEIYIDPSKTNSVEFGKMALTRMACPKFEQEQAMMLALEETVNAIQGDNDRVILLKAGGEPVIVLERQAVE